MDKGDHLRAQLITFMMKKREHCLNAFKVQGIGQWDHSDWRGSHQLGYVKKYSQWISIVDAYTMSKNLEIISIKDIFETIEFHKVKHIGIKRQGKGKGITIVTQQKSEV